MCAQQLSFPFFGRELSLVCNTPLALELQGAPGYLEHSMMSGDTPQYMLADTAQEGCSDSDATELDLSGSGEKTQAHCGHPGSSSSPMDESQTPMDALVTPSVQGGLVLLSPPTVDLGRDMALALARAQAAEAEVVALREVAAECGRREAELRVQVAQAQEGRDVAVWVFQKRMLAHRASFKKAWDGMKASRDSQLEAWLVKKLDEMDLEREEHGVVSRKCRRLERKVARLESRVGQLEEEAGRREATALASSALAPPPCPICLDGMVERLVALACGHVLHGDCARAVETSSHPHCPECLHPVFKRDILRLFFSPSVVTPVGGGGSRDGPSTRASRRL